MGSDKGISAKIAEYLQQYKGQIISLNRMVEELEEDPDRVQTAMRNLRNNSLKGCIEVIAAGRAWVFNGIDTGQSSDTFEYIGRTREGAYIIQDTAGILYRATPID